MGIVFLDVETTGLDPETDTIIEIALIGNKVEKTYWIDLTPEELGKANSNALSINNYYERLQVHHVIQVAPDRRNTIALDIAQFTAGHILAGNTVKFDQQFLGAWMRRHGAAPVWDYHVLDIPTYAAGWINGQDLNIKNQTRPPFRSNTISKLLGVPEPEERHTAMGDARWSKSIWEKIHGDS